MQRHLAGIFEPVAGAQGNEGGLVLVEHEFLVIAGYARGTGHHDPMLRPVMMHLKAELGTGIDDDALDLKALARVDALVRAPGAIDLAMLDMVLATLSLE